MTTDTIEALHRHLDDHPDDSTCRMVLADAYDEIGSPLAAGYRALGRLGAYPTNEWRDWAGALEHPPDIVHKPDRWAFWITNWNTTSEVDDDWWFLWRAGIIEFRETNSNNALPYYMPSRRQAEDLLAKVFPQLPEWQQGRLLAGIKTKREELGIPITGATG